LGSKADIFYAAATRLGSGGVGGIAENAVRALAGAERLHSVAAYGKPPEDIPAERFSAVKKPLRNPLVGKKRRRLKERFAFDAATINMLSDEVALFHGWNANCLDTLHAARDRGIKTVVERASTHMIFQMRILRGAYETVKIDPGRIELDEVIARCVEEYDVADCVLVPSMSVYDSFVDEGFDTDKLILLPFGVDIKRFSPAPEPPEKPVFLFCGRIGIRKGVHHLLEAWKQASIKDARLVLVGNVDQEFEDMLPGLMDRETTEVVSYSDDMQALYRKATAFVLPTLEEGSALVTYEAMASGLPLITTVRAGSVARDGIEAVVISPGDVDCLANALSDAASDPERMREMGKAARGRVENFTWAKYRERLLEVYKRILSGERPVKLDVGLDGQQGQ
jgi:glycosyltransferase involved in cell wall biosynthesis